LRIYRTGDHADTFSFNIRALSARLGHSNTSTTLNIYSHALRSADKVAAEKIEEIMFKEPDAK
jgi:integrase